jgi:hypothetical protein
MKVVFFVSKSFLPIIIAFFKERTMRTPRCNSRGFGG